MLILLEPIKINGGEADFSFCPGEKLIFNEEREAKIFRQNLSRLFRSPLRLQVLEQSNKLLW